MKIFNKFEGKNRGGNTVKIPRRQKITGQQSIQENNGNPVYEPQDQEAISVDIAIRS